jgi:two-component system response regulator EvgA
MSKVLLIDNQPMIRFATRVLLEREGYEIVGETEVGVEGLSLARALQPDLVIVDIAIPKLDGLEVVSRLSAMDPNLKLLVLTSLPASLYANRCLQAGATGYLSKQENEANLLSAIRSLLSGYSLFPSAVQLPTSMNGKVSNDVQLLESLSAESGQWQEQQGNRRAAVHQPQDSQHLQVAADGQTEDPQSGRPDRLRPSLRADRLTRDSHL